MSDSKGRPSDRRAEKRTGFVFRKQLPGSHRAEPGCWDLIKKKDGVDEVNAEEDRKCGLWGLRLPAEPFGNGKKETKHQPEGSRPDCMVYFVVKIRQP